MSNLDRMNVGIVGSVGRGRSFRAGFEANGARILAVCDANTDKLGESAANLGADEAYADFEEMLDKSDLDAVVVGTPMQFHAEQSAMALERGLHVLCEVTAAISLEECRRLVAAAEASSATYMMAENYTYRKECVIVGELARQGLFGETYYGEGEYLHELKGLNERTVWRRKWQTGIEGVTYGTHSLGPLLQWMGADRVVRVCCEGTGNHYADPRGDAYHSESPVLLCKTAKGALIKIRVDMVSDRPHAMTNYQLQGTDGAYESGRGGPVDRPKIWLRKLTDDPVWFDLDELLKHRDFAEEHVPEIWRNPPEAALRAGHGGGDFFEVYDFLRACRGEAPCPIGIHEAMDMTLPGLVSQQSILQGGAWLAVPDSRTWAGAKPKLPQLHMVWPEEKLDAPPATDVPDGYALRVGGMGDAEGYCALMEKAGFSRWTPERLKGELQSVVPEGFFVVEHRATGAIAAAAMAHHKPREAHPSGGEVGWVASNPEHAGKGLGAAATAAAVRRLLAAGYRRIYLLTDDWRLPALKVYLRMGFKPCIVEEDMKRRWHEAAGKLGWELKGGDFRK